MNQVLVLADLPILFERGCYSVIYHLSGLIVTTLVLDYLKFNFSLFFFDTLLFFGLSRPHFYKVVNTLPDKAIIVRLIQRVEIVRLSR